MKILSTDRALPTIRHMGKILGKVSPLPYSPKIMVACRELCMSRSRPSLTGIEWLR